MPRDQHRPRELAICRGLGHLAVVFVIYIAFVVASVAARRLSMACALFTLVVIVNVVYLGIYALEYYDVIDRERCDSLIEIGQGWSLVGNLFSPTPLTIRPWPKQILAAVARLVARVLPAQAEEEEGGGGSL